MTQKIRKILVPLDGSKNSLRGLKFALNLSKQSGSSILGLHVSSLPFFLKTPEIIDQKNKKSKCLKKLYWARVISALLLTPYVFFQYIFSDLTYLPVRIFFVIFSFFILYLLVKRWGKETTLRRK